MKALILWHYYSQDWNLVNSSSTLFSGTPDELQKRLQEEYDKNKETRGKPQYLITIAQQIIVLPG